MALFARLTRTLSWVVWLASCKRSQPVPTEKPQPTAVVAPAPPARAEVQAHAMSDRELGRLIDALSEPSREFPSENLVSNETSYAHVAPALRALPKGRAYIGVGPEQNFTYIALLEPKLAYIVDIRRQNLVLCLMYKALFKNTSSRADFLAALIGRDKPVEPRDDAAIDEVIAHALAAPISHVPRALLWTRELVDALALPWTRTDDRHLEHLVDVFAKQGLDVRYAMKGSNRAYPSLRALLIEGGRDGFLGSHANYSTVKALFDANGVVPVVGDFAGNRAMRAVADDMRARGLELGVFYVSNVEQYLFEARTWPAFVDNVRQLPFAADGQFVRVYFDQGRAHPSQRRGHRTTTLLMPHAAFAEQAARTRSFWQLVTTQSEH